MPRTDMGGVADSVSWKCNSGSGVRPTSVGNGVLYAISKVRMRDIIDGSSNTLMVGEITGSLARDICLDKPSLATPLIPSGGQLSLVFLVHAPFQSPKGV